MINEIKDIPEGYRHMFYPMPTIQLDLRVGAGFDFQGMTERRQKALDELNLKFFLGIDKEKEREDENEVLLRKLKYAYIVEGEKHFITYVNNETMQAYRMHDNSYYDGLLLPLTEITNFTFDRWCRGMDL